MRIVFEELKKAKSRQRALAAINQPSCPNVHKNETDGCAVYFDSPYGTRYLPSKKTIASMSEDDFNPRAKAMAKKIMERTKGKVYRVGETFHHITPKMASGCNNWRNLVPDSELQDGSCKSINELQSKLEQIGPDELPNELLKP